MASAVSACVYKTVTLAVGEVFTLPPGAELIASSGGLESFTSTCPKPDTLDVTKRYRIQWEIEKDSNNHTDPWENAAFTGVSIGGAPQVTTWINGFNGQSNLQNWLINTVQAPFTNYTQTSRSGGSYVQYFGLEFSSPSLIAESTLFYIKAEGRTGGDTGTYMEIIPFAI